MTGTAAATVGGAALLVSSTAVNAPFGLPDAPTLMAIAALLTATAGAFGLRSSRRDTRRIQEAANVLAREQHDAAVEKADRDYLRGLLEDHRVELDRRDAQIDRERAEHRAEVERQRAEHRRREHERAAECAAVVTHLTDTIRVLRDVVTDEITSAAAVDVVDEQTRHVRGHLADLDNDGAFGP